MLPTQNSEEPPFFDFADLLVVAVKIILKARISGLGILEAISNNGLFHFSKWEQEDFL